MIVIRLMLFAIALAAGLAMGNIHSAWAEQRVAIVIGNAHYQYTPALPNPGNDAADLAATLSDLGFKVTALHDLTKRDFDRALAQFARDAKGADAALFFYAGHGMQFQGRNYLMPVDAELKDKFSLRSDMIAVDDVKASLLDSNGVKLLILDACRNNPLAEQLKHGLESSTREIPRVQGFAPEGRAQGFATFYSTQFEMTAYDGSGRNSPFSAALLKELREPGLEVEELFRKVENDVLSVTGGQQSPEYLISGLPYFHINQSETDQMVWFKIRDSADERTLTEFVRRFPQSVYVPDANARLDLFSTQKQELAEAYSIYATTRAAAIDMDRLLSQQKSLDDAAGDARTREQDLAKRLADAEAERAHLLEQLAQAGLERSKMGEQAKADTDKVGVLIQKEADLEAKAASARAEADRQARQAADARQVVQTMQQQAALPKMAPVEPKPASADLSTKVWVQLRRLGCFTGADADWTAPSMKLSLAKYARYAGLAAPGPNPDQTLLDDMAKRAPNLCPPECAAGEMLVARRCVARACPDGQARGMGGACVRPPPPHPRNVVARPVLRVAAPRPIAREPAEDSDDAPVRARSNSKCFTFDGKQYCG